MNLPKNLGTNDSYIVGDQQLKFIFDLNVYKPDDVSVKVNDNVLEGKIRFFSLFRAVHVDNTRENQINRECVNMFYQNILMWINYMLK